MNTLALKLKIAAEDIRGVLLCGRPHPLSEHVFCMEARFHPPTVEHSFGPEPGMAIWRDGDKEWRFRPTTIGHHVRWEGR